MSAHQRLQVSRRPRLKARRAAAALAAGLACGVVAFAFAAAPLLVPAVALTLLGLATPAWVWATARGGRLDRRLRAARVVEDEPVEATIDVRRGLLGMPGAVVSDPFSGARIELADALASVRGERRASVRVVASFPRRGLHRLEAPTLTVSDPLGLATATLRSNAAAAELLVLPRTQRVRWLGGTDVRRLLIPDGAAADDALAAVDLDGLRSYRPGTPASRIYWPAVARGAGLLERRLRTDGDSRPLIVLDLRTPGRDGGTAVDAAVRAAASLVLDLAPAGCELLIGGDQRPTTINRSLAAWPDAYARLAVARGGPGAPAPVLTRAGARAGAMIYVAAAAWARVVTTLATRAGGPVVLVIPDVSLAEGLPPVLSGSAREALAVTGCRGFLLASGRVRVTAAPAQARAAAK